jgi:phenylacetate-CoA ligase
MKWLYNFIKISSFLRHYIFKQKICGLIVYNLLTKQFYRAGIDIKNWQSKKIFKILKYARLNSEYYRGLISGYNMDSLSQIPFLDKELIRVNQNKIISKKLKCLYYYNMNTGGSTGEPIDFPVSPHYDSIHQKFHFTLMGYKKGDRIASFDGVTIDEYLRKENIFWKKSGNDIPYGSIAFSSLYLNNSSIKFYIEHLFSLRPAFLRGYPSFINELATYILNNHIQIQFVIKGIQLTAENVFDYQIENIKNAFQANVYLQYGHSEISVFGFTFDQSYEYYLSPFYGFTEVLDDSGSHVKVGEIGELVVTGFYNYVHPFIRYKTGDLALFNGYHNGFLKLKKIIGRSQDYIINRDGVKTSLTALIFGQHYKSFSRISKWQIIQNERGKVLIKILKANGFTLDDENEIRSKFKKICSIDVDFEYVQSFPITSRGKFIFLVQNIQNE